MTIRAHNDRRSVQSLTIIARTAINTHLSHSPSVRAQGFSVETGSANSTAISSPLRPVNRPIFRLVSLHVKIRSTPPPSGKLAGKLAGASSRIHASLLDFGPDQSSYYVELTKCAIFPGSMNYPLILRKVRNHRKSVYTAAVIGKKLGIKPLIIVSRHE